MTRSIWYKRIWPRSGGLLEDAVSIAMLGLVVLGLGGTLYKSLKPGGWLTLVLDRLWDQNPWLVWFLGFGAAALLALGKWWVSHSPRAGRRSDVLVYTFLALGLFFCFKLIVTGTL
jgi:hypothetical protein